jgi:hypothetical protein
MKGTRKPLLLTWSVAMLLNSTTTSSKTANSLDSVIAPSKPARLVKLDRLLNNQERRIQELELGLAILLGMRLFEVIVWIVNQF